MLLRTLLCAFIVIIYSTVSTADPDDPPVARTRYDNYRLYDVTPTAAAQLRVLADLCPATSDDNHLCLQTSHRPGDTWQLVVAPHKQTDFELGLRSAGVPFSLRSDDLQSVIDAEARQNARSHRFDWSSYQTIERIYEWLDQIAVDYSALVTPITVGTSFEGRPIRGVRISAAGGSDGDAARRRRPGVFIEGGIHAREWISPAFVTYLINELLTSRNASVRWAADTHDWYIVPSVNPDGYAHTHRGDRLWRKTRQPHGFWCRGADPNRNWDFHWNEHSTSPLPCSDIYAGPRAFSEPEMRSYAEYLRGLNGSVQTFVGFHSYSQLLLYPYGHTAEPPPNAGDLRAIGEAAARALAARYGTQYRVGGIYETIYPASGASADWAYGVLGVPLAFTYELRPSDRGWRGFELPAEQIVPVGEETVDSLVALLRRARELGYNKEVEGAGGDEQPGGGRKSCGVVRLF